MAEDSTISPGMRRRPLPVGWLYGSIASLCLIGLTLGTYLSGPEAFIGWVSFLRYPIVIVIGIMATWTVRQQNGGFIRFREAVRTCFTIFVVAFLVQAIFTWLLVNVIDTHFRAVLLPVISTREAAVYKEFGASQQDIDKALAAEKGSNPFAPASIAMGLAFSYIILFIVAALVALTLKRKQA